MNYCVFAQKENHTKGNNKESMPKHLTKCGIFAVLNGKNDDNR